MPEGTAPNTPLPVHHEYGVYSVRAEKRRGFPGVYKMPTLLRCIKFKTVEYVNRDGEKTIRRLSVAQVLALPLLQFTIALAGKLTFSSGSHQVTLLELFTSQGCSSCPPAERWLNEYVKDEDLWSRIVPLAFHVDYWDYLGWKDKYADPENGERQRDYARMEKARSVYQIGRDGQTAGGAGDKRCQRHHGGRRVPRHALPDHAPR